MTPEEYPTARILMSLMVANLALTFPNSVFDSFTSANERFFFQKLLVVFQNFLNPFLTLPLLIMGYGSIGIVCITTFLTVTKLLINMWYSFKSFTYSSYLMALSLVYLEKCGYLLFLFF